MANQLGDSPVRNKEEEMDQSNLDNTGLNPSIYGCEIILEKTTIDKVKDKSFPTDARIVKYVDNGIEYIDLTRGKKMVSIFDMYYDRYGPGAVKSIDFGYGSVNPKMWGYKSPEKKKRKWFPRSRKKNSGKFLVCRVFQKMSKGFNIDSVDIEMSKRDMKRLIKKYKKLKKYQNSNLHEIQTLGGKDTIIEKLIKESEDFEM